MSEGVKVLILFISSGGAYASVNAYLSATSPPLTTPDTPSLNSVSIPESSVKCSPISTTP